MGGVIWGPNLGGLANRWQDGPNHNGDELHATGTVEASFNILLKSPTDVYLAQIHCLQLLRVAGRQHVSALHICVNVCMHMCV